MNIFEELAESYTYNGVVSLKALEDDIVTLENQIDNFNATLREVQLRGKKPGPLVGKIRDAKIRLSLLKAVYKRESDKATPDDVILNMLGVSANNAKEVNRVSTAADGREPKPQNFESAELEEIVDEEVTADVKAPETEKAIDSDVDITEEYDKEMQASVLQGDSDDEIVVNDKGLFEEEVNEIYAGVKGENPIVLSETGLTVQTRIEPIEVEIKPVGSEPIFKESGVKWVNIDKVPTETETKTVDVEKVMKEKETKLTEPEQITTNDEAVVYNENESTEEPDAVPPLTQDDYLEPIDGGAFVESEIDSIENAEGVPPPTMDDYLEPESGPSYENVLYDENGVVYNCENDPEQPEVQAVIAENATTHNIPGEVVISEDNALVYEDVPAYDAFVESESKIYASFDLSSYTDMVNTDSVKGMYSNMTNTIEVTFTDILDYDIFLKLAKEKLERECFVKRLFKKPKSIFMVVYEKIGDEQRQHRFEFIGCRVIETMDTEHTSLRDSVYYGNNKHECYVRFKYKKLKIE